MDTAGMTRRSIAGQLEDAGVTFEQVPGACGAIAYRIAGEVLTPGEAADRYLGGFVEAFGAAPAAQRRTYRERREARADRLEEWAGKREASGTAAVERAREMGAAIPFGQPMLVDHHSYRRDVNYRNRIGRTYDRGFEDLAKARGMASRAAEIRAQAEHAIYSDDDDAIVRLEARIVELEAERDRIKAFNASCRKVAGGDASLLDERQRGQLASVRTHTPYTLGKQGQMPGYALSNLTGNIGKQRKRLEELRRRA